MSCTCGPSHYLASLCFVKASKAYDHPVGTFNAHPVFQAEPSLFSSRCSTVVLETIKVLAMFVTFQTALYPFASSRTMGYVRDTGERGPAHSSCHRGRACAPRSHFASYLPSFHLRLELAGRVRRSICKRTILNRNVSLCAGSLPAREIGYTL